MENSLMKIPNLGNNRLRFVLNINIKIKSDELISSSYDFKDTTPQPSGIIRNKYLVRIRKDILNLFRKFNSTYTCYPSGEPKYDGKYNFAFFVMKDIIEIGGKRFLELGKEEFKRDFKGEIGRIYLDPEVSNQKIFFSDSFSYNTCNNIKIEIEYFTLRESIISFIYQKEGESDLYLFLKEFFIKCNDDIDEDNNFDDYIDYWASRLLNSSCSDDFESSVRRGV